MLKQSIVISTLLTYFSSLLVWRLSFIILYHPSLVVVGQLPFVLGTLFQILHLFL